MVCKNCGFQINNGMYCPNCGKQADYGDSNTNLNNNNIDVYIKEFIGENYDEFKKGGFSWCTLIFGVLYTLFRRMYLFSFVWLLIAALTNYFVPTYGIVITLILNIIIAFFTKKLYLDFANNKVKGILKRNSNKSELEILNICKKNGGSSVLSVPVGFVFVFIIYLLLLAIETGGNFSIDRSNEKKDASLGYLKYVENGNMKETERTSSSVKYEMHNGICFVKLSEYSDSGYTDTNDFLKRNVESVRNFGTRNFSDGNHWVYAESGSLETDDLSEYYAVNYKNKIYVIQYSRTKKANNSRICFNTSIDLVRSLELE